MVKNARERKRNVKNRIAEVVETQKILNACIEMAASSLLVVIWKVVTL